MKASLQQIDEIEVAIYARPDGHLWIASAIDHDVCAFGYNRVDALDRFRRALDDEEQLAQERNEKRGIRAIRKPPKGAIPEVHKRETVRRKKSGRWAA